MTTRRGFLGSILALGAAPAIVRAGSLMKIATSIWTPPLFIDGPPCRSGFIWVPEFDAALFVHPESGRTMLYRPPLCTVRPPLAIPLLQ